MPEPVTKHVNKVVYNNEVLVDLTQDTVNPAKLAKDFTAHDKSGAIITGTMTGDEDVVAQSKSVTPTAEEQIVAPDEGFTHLSQVTVAAIPYVEAENDAGGTTITIG